jgi:hypothetical protein
LVIAHAFVLAALLGVDAGGGAASEAPPAQQGSSDPLAWLLGNWTGSGFLTAELEPEESGPHHWKPRGPDTLRLTFRADDGKIKGVLDASNGKKKARVEIVIDLHADDPLVWREAGRRYRFHLQRPPEERDLRFADMRGPTKHGISYPPVIEIEMRDGKLLLNRYNGPQHGALASDAYRFQRAP